MSIFDQLNMRWPSILISGLLVSFCGVVLFSVMTWASLQPLPDNLPTLSNITHKPQLLDRHSRPLTVTYQNHWNVHDVVPLHRIPEFLQNSFTLAEDKRFYDHNGVDWLARLQALWQNALALRSVRGASTITEQVVRMLHSRPRTLWARWLEGWEAYALELKYDKATILELNRPGIVGDYLS